MTIPTRAEAAKILHDLASPEWHKEHSAAVADVASFLATAIERQGHTISVPSTEAAALLHDLAKGLPNDHPLKGVDHGEAGAEWLRQHGYHELAGAVAGHPVTRLADDDYYAGWSRGATVEERVVAYADKRATKDLVSMDERFGRWVERHGDTDVMRVARQRADLLEADICKAAGIRPEDVQRARWAEAALAEAALAEAAE